jgi:predicted amidohydrolase
MAAELNIIAIQTNIAWEDRDTNLADYEQQIESITDKKEVIVLPEMFTTGFSMQPEALAEDMNGVSVTWMKNMAAKHRCIITGSLIIKEEGKFYNRLLWVQPDGKIGQYDKRHLFGYAEEDKHYTPGSKRLIAQVKGIRICLMVCYDLRFPVWARNQGEEYDVLLYVANWPEKRSLAWKTLLQARAIENQCYVIGVNRVGMDGKGINYSGGSSFISPMGEILWQLEGAPATRHLLVQQEVVNDTRQQLPFLKDADKFILL